MMSEESKDSQTHRITHDIKNTLAVITMRCDECLKNPDLNQSIRNNIEQIKIAVGSVIDFTKQLSSPDSKLTTHPSIQSNSSKPEEDLSAIPGQQTILVAEDEQQLRRLICSALRDNRYTVLEAENGAKALETFRKNPAIDMIITDMTMPEMGGYELTQNIAKMKTGMKILYLSGSDNFVEQGFSEAPPHFLEKPFPRNILIEKVKKILAL